MSGKRYPEEIPLAREAAVSGRLFLHSRLTAHRPLVATAALALLGIGTTLALAGTARSELSLGIGGGMLAAAALVLLLAAGWLEGLPLVALSLPLPAFYSTEQLRLSLAPMLTATVLVAWILARAAARRPTEPSAMPRVPSLLLLAAVALAGLFAEHRLIALREFLNFSLYLGLLAVATDTLTAAPRKARALGFTLAALAGASGVLAVLQALGILPGRFPLSGTAFNRATLGFGWPNELAIFIALSLPFSVYACETARNRIALVAAILGLGAAVAGLAATFSRGSWLAVLGAALVLWLAGERRFALRVWAVALLAAAALDLASAGAIRYRAESAATGWVLTQRLALTAAGLVMFLEHPLFGVGPGAFGESLDRFGPQVVQLWDYTGSAQNGFVHMAAETGALGVTALVLFFATILGRLIRGVRRARRHPAVPPDEVSLRRAVLWSFAIACLVSLGEWPFAQGNGQMIALVAAMGLALEHSRPSPSTRP